MFLGSTLHVGHVYTDEKKVFLNAKLQRRSFKKCNSISLHSRKNVFQLGFEPTLYGMVKEPIDLIEVKVIFSRQKNCLFSTLCIEWCDAIFAKHLS